MPSKMSHLIVMKGVKRKLCLEVLLRYYDAKVFLFLVLLKLNGEILNEL